MAARPVALGSDLELVGARGFGPPRAYLRSARPFALDLGCTLGVSNLGRGRSSSVFPLGRGVAVACLIAVSACGPQGSQVPVNTGDTTAPAIFSLETVGRRGGELRVTQTSGPVSGTLAADESIAVVARADDPEGVLYVGIWGGRKLICAEPSGGYVASGTALVTSTDTAVAGGTTTVQRIVSYPVRFTDLECPEGSGLPLEFEFWAGAGNFGGMSTDSNILTLKFIAP